MNAEAGQSLTRAQNEHADTAVRTRIALQNVVKRFTTDDREFVALDDVSFSVKQGEFVALLGPSGCGKSTILNMVAGLLPRSGGRILIDDDAVEPGEINRKVGYVFQRDTLFPWRTVEQNIGYGVEIAGLPKAERARRVALAVEKAGLTGFGQSFPRMLSGGMRQRVALMRTLIMEPEILLMDEPFGALDAQTRETLQEELVNIWQSLKSTLLFVTHSVSEPVYLADKIVVMGTRPGRIREIISYAAPYPRDRLSADFRELEGRIHTMIREETRKLGVM